MHHGEFGTLSEVYKEYAGIIAESGRKLLHTVNQVLDMSLLSAKEEAIVEGEFLLSSVFSETVEKYRKSIGEKKIEMHLSIRDEHLRLRGDCEKIARAVENILDNAIKFCLPGGIVIMSAQRDDLGEAVVTISDTGEGIPEDRISSLFLPFEQEGSHYSRIHQGAGLGLSIALGLIRLHGGNIDIDSGVGVGTTVKITLPADRVVTDAPASETQCVA